MRVSELTARQQARWRRALLAFSGVLLVVGVFALSVGEIWIAPFGNHSVLESQLLVQLRLPRVMAAILIGASLAIAGASLQVLLGNPLAEPGVLGISGGASVAVVLLLFFAPAWASGGMMAVAAMIGASLFTLILVLLARRALATSRILLVGVALSILAGAVVTLAFYFSSDFNLRQLMYWLMGSLSGMRLSHIAWLALTAPCIAILCHFGQQLDQLMLGDVQAQQLGLDTHRLRWQLIVLISILVGLSVAAAGVIGFIGLVVPHYLRLWFGSRNRYLLPLSALAGAILLVSADTLGRLLLDAAELPVGVVTSVIGAPLFIWMLIKAV
ncbi:vitamin B12 ABC transporter permease BtuC [Salinivibrio costicola]|uniref:Vitamin B12 ABC transporter permease BtuC n=1 Tax=Salinivibrio costicola TaxID=51367 RepID=A0ABX6K578_SALCS|nr:vitamin B12 ABC transporter permease BtuC [Salinivibrio costicola]QIR06099.1 vitamin B12 ABC transporter permease BtuC [Salinivibrio costicola]